MDWGPRWLLGFLTDARLDPVMAPFERKRRIKLQIQQIGWPLSSRLSKIWILNGYLKWTWMYGSTYLINPTLYIYENLQYTNRATSGWSRSFQEMSKAPIRKGDLRFYANDGPDLLNEIRNYFVPLIRDKAVTRDRSSRLFSPLQWMNNVDNVYIYNPPAA